MVVVVVSSPPSSLESYSYNQRSSMRLYVFCCRRCEVGLSLLCDQCRAVAAPTPGSLAPHAAANTSSSSYTFVQIKREPCQVSEVTTSNNNCHQSLTTTTHHHGLGTIASGSSASSASSSSSLSSASAAATSKTMSSSTLTTLVKIEASSPKVQELDKSHVTNALQTQSAANIVNSSNNYQLIPLGSEIPTLLRKLCHSEVPLLFYGDDDITSLGR
ncbi:hypothetical protein GQX74_000637 [Glossina fuscipes]|uniref:Uncharacterized protein n=1 Tax=Glossina palpalis gambiensis TaxID=67801 RepID=A0A1B0BNL9_9MUSC|nr:hypothetical protein GQX74_000637 [Glossina fuscipes]